MRAVCLLRKAGVISVRTSVIDIKRSTTSVCMMFVAQLDRETPCGKVTSPVPWHAAIFSFSLLLRLSSICVQSIFNQPIYRAHAKIAQQQKTQMSREASIPPPPLPSALLIRSVCCWEWCNEQRAWCVDCFARTDSFSLVFPRTRARTQFVA